MKRFFSLFLVFLLGAGGVFGSRAQAAAPVFFEQLSRRIQQTPFVIQNPGMNRLRWMRFYFPTVKVAERKGFMELVFQSFSEGDRQRALAAYLYQMYISSAVYQGEIPYRLTVNYLGVLNSLERLEVPFRTEKAVAYYQKYKAEIKQWLKQFFEEAALPAYLPTDKNNDAREIEFLKTLERSLDESGRAGYRLDTPRWQEKLSAEDKEWLKKVQKLAVSDIRQKVVLYEENRTDLGAVDKMPGRYIRNGKLYLFRPAAKECAACSYLTCSQICQQIQQESSRNWGFMHLYQLQVHPLKGSFLKSADGGKFHSPKGAVYPDWFYHEAVLVIMNHGSQYVPAVLDYFLSDEPMGLEEWLNKFNARETVLYAYPFIRWSDTEKRLVRPDQIQENKVWKEGRAYQPYPVEG